MSSEHYPNQEPKDQSKRESDFHHPMAMTILLETYSGLQYTPPNETWIQAF